MLNVRQGTQVYICYDGYPVSLAYVQRVTEDHFQVNGAWYKIETGYRRNKSTITVISVKNKTPELTEQYKTDAEVSLKCEVMLEINDLNPESLTLRQISLLKEVLRISEINKQNIDSIKKGLFDE